MVLSAQYSLRHLEAAAAPNQFRLKPRVPSLVSHFLRVSYVCVISR